MIVSQPVPHSIMSEFVLDGRIAVAPIKPYEDALKDAIYFWYAAWNLAYDDKNNVIYAEDTRKND